MRHLTNKRRYQILVSSAKTRGISVNISQHEYSELINLGCMYCGTSLDENKGVGLDRIDSSKGYHFDNVTPCCGTCNVAKNAMQVEEFFEWIDRVYDFKKKMVDNLQELNYTDRDIRKLENTFKNSSMNRNSKRLLVLKGR